MNFNALVLFVRQKMRMEHVYQPLIVKTLVESGGAATINQLAREFAAADERQVAFYEKRIREMPIRVLRRHGVIKVTKNLVELDTSKLTFPQKTELIAACNERIARFVTERGDGVWSGLMQLNPVPDSTRYLVLKRDRICLLCGNGPEEAPLEVDHIIPRSLGGSNDLSNLQVLCRPCNQGKSNHDSTDFTKSSKSNASMKSKTQKNR